MNDDKKLFDDAMSGVTPLNSKNKIRHSKKLVCITQQKESITDIDYFWRDGEDLNYLNIDEEVTFKHPGVHLKSLKNPKAIIDLHGMSKDQAAIAFHNKITKCYNENIRTLKLIHGKGKAILKSAIHSWLQKHPLILGFCSAPNHDGGSGCLYILIRRNI